MALTHWRQTMKKNGVLLKHAAVHVYLAGTTDAARVFDANGALSDSVPQLYTDWAGFAEFWLDPDDYPTGQLFDVDVNPDKLCCDEETLEFPNLQILQDTEGYRNFKNVFTQDAEPTEGMKEGDLWIDTDDGNTLYVYEDGTWTPRRPKKIIVGDTDVGSYVEISDAGIFTYVLGYDAHAECLQDGVGWQNEAYGSVEPIDAGFVIDIGDRVIGGYNYKWTATGDPVGGIFWDQSENKLYGRVGQEFGLPYIIGFFWPSNFGTSEVVILHKFSDQGATFPAGMSESKALSLTAATAETIFSMKKNDVEFGTITFSASGTTGTFSVASDTSFVEDDVLKVVAPATPDNTLSKVSFTLKGMKD